MAAMLGRPSKYTDELLEQCRQYLESGYLENEELFPSHVGLCLHVGIARSTAYEWDKDPEKHLFSDIFDKIMMRQELNIVKNAMIGEYNSTISKVMLTKHGYSDKNQTELTGADGGAVKTESTWIINPIQTLPE
jgi:hypothetical protein